MRQREDVLDEHRQPDPVVLDDLEHAVLVRVERVAVVPEQLGVGPDRGEGRAELVGEGREELALGPVELLELVDQLPLALVEVGLDDGPGQVGGHGVHQGDGVLVPLDDRVGHAQGEEGQQAPVPVVDGGEDPRPVARLGGEVGLLGPVGRAGQQGEVGDGQGALALGDPVEEATGLAADAAEVRVRGGAHPVAPGGRVVQEHMVGVGPEDGDHVHLEHGAEGRGDLGEGRGQVHPVGPHAAEPGRDRPHAVVHVLAAAVGVFDLLVGGDEGDGPLLDQPGQLGAAGPQLGDGIVEGQGGPDGLLLDLVEAGGHLAELVRRPYHHGPGGDDGVGLLEVVAGHGLHGRRQGGQGPAGQEPGRLGHLLGGVGQGTGEDEPHGQGQQAGGHEQVEEDGGHRRARRPQVVEGDRVARAEDDQQREHRTRDLEVDRAAWAGAVLVVPVGADPPQVGQRAGQGQQEAEADHADAQGPEAEDCGDQPGAGRDEPEADRAVEGPVRAGVPGLVPAQQPHGHAGHGDPDQVADGGGGEEGALVAGQDEGHGGGGRHQDGDHRGVGARVAAAQGAGEEAVLGQLAQRARCSGQRQEGAREHVEGHEPHGDGLGCAAGDGGEGRPEERRQAAFEAGGAEDAQPDDGEDDEVDGGHAARRPHGPGLVAPRPAQLAGEAGGGLEGRGRAADQVEAGHHAGEGAERPGERGLEVEGEGLVPRDVSRERRHHARDEGQGEGGQGERLGHPDRPPQAEEGERGEGDDDGHGHGCGRDTGEVPGVEGLGGQDGGEAPGGDPAPPVGDASEVREHGAVGSERLGAGGCDTAHLLGEHAGELDPPRCGHEGEEQAEGEEGDGRSALGGQDRAEDEQGLVGAAEGQRRGP